MKKLILLLSAVFIVLIANGQPGSKKPIVYGDTLPPNGKLYKFISASLTTGLAGKVDKTTTAATFTGIVDLSKDKLKYPAYTMTGPLVINIDITKDSTGFACGKITSNGTAPTTRLTLWPGSDSFSSGSGDVNYFEIEQIYGIVYIAWKKLN